MSTKENVSFNEENKAICIGNGQVHDAIKPSEEVSKTLNCLADPMKVLIYRKQGHPQTAEQGQGWEETQVNDTLNAFDSGEMRTPTIICEKRQAICIGNGQEDNARNPSIEVSKTLNCLQDPMKIMTTRVYENHSQDTRYREMGEVCQPISATFGMGGNNQPFVVKEVFDASRRHSYESFGDISGTVQAHFGTGGGNVPVVLERADGIVSKGNGECFLTKDRHMSLTIGGGQAGQGYPCILETKEPILLESNQNHATIQTDGVSTSLPASMGMGGGYVPMITQEPVAYRGDAITSPQNASNPKPGDPCHTLIDDGINYLIGEKMETVVRRLTPLECERLQGYPDGWTDIGDWVDTKGKTHKGESDSPRYKALGNSIALPFWQYMAEKMVAQYDRPATMASLFDGIGGFPLVFSRCGCTPVWASEIEEFPIAVTKVRFPENE